MPLLSFRPLPFAPAGEQRTFHVEGVLLFYCKRKEKVFRELSGLWGNARVSHICQAQLCAPPSASATLYSPDEAKWCKESQKALIAMMDNALKKELEIPEPAQDRVPSSARASSEASVPRRDQVFCNTMREGKIIELNM